MQRQYDSERMQWDSERSYYAGMGETDVSALVATPSGHATKQAETPWYETLAKSVVPAVAAAYQQKQLTKLNLSRINQGQPPITAQEYAAVYQPPSAQVLVGPDQTLKRVMVGAGLLAAVYFGLRAAKVL